MRPGGPAFLAPCMAKPSAPFAVRLATDPGRPLQWGDPGALDAAGIVITFEMEASAHLCA
jgi:hypothetical protein